MKLSTKIILPIILISALLILLNGCMVVPDDSPGYAPGTTTISGIIAAPCCSTSSLTAVSEAIAPSDWCLQCEVNWFLQKNIEVILTYEGEKIGSTTTNTEGEYTFTKLSAGDNYVITAICPDDGGKPLVKDVVKEVVDGKNYDAGITDCESTALGILVDALVNLGISSEYIILEDIQGAAKFESFVEALCEVLEDCGDVTADDDLLDLGNLVLMEILGENPGWTGGEVICVFNIPETYVLTTIANPPEGGTVSGAGTYDLGTVVPVTASPAVGWSFTGWSGDLSGTTNPGNVTMNSNKSVTAHFSAIDYIVALSDNPSGAAATLTGAGPYNFGDTVNIGTTADTGYAFVNWTDDDNSGAEVSTSASYSFTMPAVNVNYTANFRAIDYIVALSDNPSGAAATLTGAGPYNFGDTVNIGTTADTGYAFVNWTDDDNSGAEVSTSASYSFTMPAVNVNYTANFRAIDYIVALSDNPSGAAATLTGAGPYNFGDTVNIGTTADTGYAFVNWTDDDNSGAEVSTSASYSFTMPAVNVNYTANFRAIDYIVALSDNPSGAAATLTGAGPYNFGDTVNIGTTADTGYAFVNWTDDDNSGAEVSTSASYSFTMPAVNVNYTANFRAIDYIVALSDNPSGAAATLTGAGPYNFGDTVNIGTTADTGYAFVNWTDDDNSGAEVSTSASYSFTMPAVNVNYTANFRAIDYIVALSDNPSGAAATLTGAGPYNFGDTVNIGTTADTGYAFVNWTDDDNSGAEVSTSASYSFTMPAVNVNYTANFRAIDYIVALSDNPSGAAATLTGAGPYNFGDTVNIGTTADTGYAFVNWTDDDNSGAEVSTSASYSFTMPAVNVNYTANFRAIDYIVALSDNPSGAAATLTGAGPYNFGDTVNIGTTADTGYAFVNWTDDDNSGAEVSTSASYSFTMPAVNVNYTANFRAIDYIVALSDNPSGAAATLTGAGPYNFGDTVNIGTTADTGYAFVNWTDDDNSGAEVSTSASYSFTMPAVNVNYTANFEQLIIIEPGDLHANLGSGAAKPYWDLHVWSSITNNSSQPFEGYMRIRSVQTGTGITTYHPSVSGYTPITIDPGKGRYPETTGDYWLMINVATGSGKPKDVVVDIWIYDSSYNEVAHSTENAN